MTPTTTTTPPARVIARLSDLTREEGTVVDLYASVEDAWEGARRRPRVPQREWVASLVARYADLHPCAYVLLPADSVRVGDRIWTGVRGGPQQYDEPACPDLAGECAGWRLIDAKVSGASEIDT